MKMVKLFLILFFLLSPFSVRAQTASELLDKAVAEYESGNYEASAQLYNQLLKSGYNNGHLYYNLGNSYFRDNQYGKAFAAYQQARKLIPRDKDLNANIRLLKTKYLQNPGSIPDNIVYKAFSAFTITELLFTFLVFWVLTWSSFIGFIFLKQAPLKYAGAASAVLSVILLIILGLKYYDLSQARGVVISKEASVKSGTDINALNMFNINEGTILKVNEKRDGWVKVELSSDKRGWVNSASLAIF